MDYTVQQFINFYNWPFWLLGLSTGFFYGFFALRIKWLGGDPEDISLPDKIHQFLINFSGGFISGFLLWLLSFVDFLKNPLLWALIFLFFCISLFGYFPHFVINILLGGKLFSDLLSKLLRQ